jgi:hypothetical protein
MQAPKVCDHTDQLLTCEVGFADRYVYSAYFVPLPLVFNNSDVPILTYYQKLMLLPYLAMAEWLNLPRPQDLPQFASVLQRNDMTRLVEKLRANRPDDVRDTPAAGGSQVEVYDGVREVLESLERLEEAVAAKADAASEVAIQVRALQRNREELMAATTRLSARTGAQMVSTSYAAKAAPNPGVSDHPQLPPFPRGLQDGSLSSEQQADLVLKLLQTQIGWLFLDRTRIRPSGYVIGEHVHSLSLAPGEELVVEQKTYSKRQTTYDEQTERERQFDLELSSSLSTELQEGLDEQTNRNSTNGQGIGAITGFDVQLNLFDIVNLQKFKTTEASNDTRRKSVKESQTATSKVAAKYRALHKIEFKVSREEGFESTSKRTLRNPSKYTPIQLHYFKVLHKMDMKQERYGARLCWTPYLQDPGRDVYRRIVQGREAILKAAENSVEVPTEPPMPVLAGKPPINSAAATTIGAWNLDGSTSTSVFVNIAVPPGYAWDGSFLNVKVSIDTQINRARILLAIPTAAAQIGTNVRVTAMVVVASRSNWLDLAEYSPVNVVAEARFVPDPVGLSAEFRKRMEDWQALHGAWERQVIEARKEAREGATGAADAWEEQAMGSVNALSEMMGRFVSDRFDASFRDEFWEVDLWQKVFDWGSATYRLYPGWWANGTLRDPKREPAHLLNASWARLYVPINIGYERIALRWIYGRVIASKLSAPVEEAFDTIVNDLEAYRSEWFGVEETGIDVDDVCPEYEEKTVCLARWSELLPTDGTHLEIVQSATSAVDDYTKQDLDDTAAFRKAALEGQEAADAFRAKIGDQITQPVEVKVVIPGAAPAEP